MNEWRARKEDYLNDAELVLVFEGGLHTMLNFGGDTLETESRMRAYLARLTTTQIDYLRSNLNHAFYWFSEDAVIEFISKLGHSDEEILKAVSVLLNNRNDTA